MCTKPLLKLRTNKINPKTNEYECVWLPKEAYLLSLDELHDRFKEMLIEIPCGKCCECKKNQKQQIAVRAFLAFQNEPNVFFITLTFKSDLEAQKAEKSPKEYLTNKLQIENENYLASFEHGETTGRPHYHVLINLDPNKKQLITKWQKSTGFIKIEAGQAATIFYTANYTTKKQNNNDIVFFSRSLGKDQFLQKLYKNNNIDNIIINGKIYALPRYFQKLKYKYLKTTPQEKRLLSETKAIQKEASDRIKRQQNDNFKADKIAYNNYRENNQKQQKTRNLKL